MELWIGTNILKVEHQSEYNHLKHLTAKMLYLFRVGGKTFDYSLALLDSSIVFAANVLIEMPAHTVLL
jgi:hypothetical protein